jgi:hypothetical protein
MNEKSLSYLIALLFVIAIGIWGALVLNQMSVDPAHAPFCSGDPNTEWFSCFVAGAGLLVVVLPGCGIGALVLFALLMGSLGDKR